LLLKLFQAKPSGYFSDEEDKFYQKHSRGTSVGFLRTVFRSG